MENANNIEFCEQEKSLTSNKFNPSKNKVS